MTHSSIEIEFKTLLSEANYYSLLKNINPLSTDFFTQTNVYFDTHDFILRGKNMGLRIRTTETKAELTLKSPLAVGLLETTDLLTLEEGDELIKKERIFKDGFVWHKLVDTDVNPELLEVKGQLKTRRWEKQLTPDFLLVLDESWYHDQHDFELELEASNEEKGKIFFDKLLEELNIPYEPALNKVARTLAEKLST